MMMADDNQNGDEYDKLVEKYDIDTKLDIACWVINKIDQHGRNPGSFRNLIYGLLRFDLNAYNPLYTAGGMNITNELDYSTNDTLRDIIERHQIENVELKKFALICDEPMCYRVVSCGWPIEDGGYRHTCGEHWVRKE
jgi:hypothetical protein